MTIDEKVDRLQVDVSEIKQILSQVLRVRTGGGGVVSGRFKAPADLSPAIAALSEEARAHMYAQIGNRSPTTKDIAQAADWDQQRKVA